jgi:hypothetical protein
VQPEFATFFLGFMRGHYDFLNLFHDLATLDPELYKYVLQIYALQTFSSTLHV